MCYQGIRRKCLHLRRGRFPHTFECGWRVSLRLFARVAIEQAGVGGSMHLRILILHTCVRTLSYWGIQTTKPWTMWIERICHPLSWRDTKSIDQQTKRPCYARISTVSPTLIYPPTTSYALTSYPQHARCTKLCIRCTTLLDGSSSTVTFI
jgi:hypothetical protein